MYSDARNECSHSLGFPIRKSPDHSLLAASRSLSQLTTSFIAYLRQGIHTHALSSLTIKSILNTDVLSSALLHLLVVNARQYSIVKEQESFQFSAVSFQLSAKTTLAAKTALAER